MMASVETYLRRGRRTLQKVLLEPRLHAGARLLLGGGGGFLLSAASLGSFAQPLAMGCICATEGWQAVMMALGAMLGYRVFWGNGGNQGVVWSAAGCILALLLSRQKQTENRPVLLAAAAGVLVAVTGLAFRLVLKDLVPVPNYFLRILLAMAAAGLFARAQQRRDPVMDWLVGGVWVLALAQVAPLPYLSLGFLVAGAMAVSCPFPGAALAGLGLDLAQITPVPMTGVMCMAYFLRLIPFEKKWLRYTAPAAACLMTMAVCGRWDMQPLPGLVLGGALGYLLPPKPQVFRRRGETGIAQVRLELTAEVLAQTQQLLLENTVPPIDEEALLSKVRQRACGSCSARKACTQREALRTQHLYQPMDIQCRKAGRLISELRRGQEQLRLLKADSHRRGEYRLAVCQQYQFLGQYLRDLADRLPRREAAVQTHYRVSVSARSKNKERANGDSCLAFSGAGCKYYVLLCDGMGTGLGAAQEGQSAGTLLQQMLMAGFPAEHALRSINSILVLRGQAGAVTMDLAEIRLDSGKVAIFKWGAAPSWLLRRGTAEKIGTATPPPGISLTESRETVSRLSLRRGETLILLSDGVDGEEILRRGVLAPDAPPGELAARILERGCGRKEDDATAVVIRLRPRQPGIS